VLVRFVSTQALEQALQVSLPASAAAMWGLAIRLQSIDSGAVKKLLATRYGWAADDAEHRDPFTALAQ
jgi:hypothetical protein